MALRHKGNMIQAVPYLVRQRPETTCLAFPNQVMRGVQGLRRTGSRQSLNPRPDDVGLYVALNLFSLHTCIMF